MSSFTFYFDCTFIKISPPFVHCPVMTEEAGYSYVDRLTQLEE